MRVLAPILVLLAAPLALARVCSDACLEAARGDYRECRQAATAALVLGRQRCLGRDPACVLTCTAREQDCGAATGIGTALEACLGQQQAAVSACRNRFPTGSKKVDSSELIWGIVSDVRYWMEWSPWGSQPWLGAGYRVLAFDHDFKGTNDADLQFRGPMVALGFVF